MKESRVSKYQSYRDSISKEDSKHFFAPSKQEEVSAEQGLFLKIQKRKNIENITIFSICVAIITTIVIFGFILF